MAASLRSPSDNLSSALDALPIKPFVEKRQPPIRGRIRETDYRETELAAPPRADDSIHVDPSTSKLTLGSHYDYRFCAESLG